MKLLLLYIFFIISLSNLYGQDNNLGDDFFRYISESRALKYGHIEPVVNDLRNIFINKGLDINVKNSEGNTALHLAASTNNLSLFYVAMSFDPNPTITNNENRTAKEEVYKYMRAHGDNSASLEMYNYLENYEKSYEIRIKINMLKEIDNLESTADRIQAFDKFVESLSTINEILGTYYFYDLYKQSLITNTTKLQIENIDLKWKEKINTIIPADMSSYKKQLQATNDVKALLQLDETITEISSCVQNELSVQNRSTLEKLQLFCQIRLSELSEKIGQIGIEKDITRLIAQFSTGDKLIEDAIAFILDLSKPFDKKKNLLLINTMTLISRKGYNGVYKQDDFIKGLKELYTLSKSYSFDIDNNTKAESIRAVIFRLEMKQRLLKDIILKVN